MIWRGRKGSFLLRVLLALVLFSALLQAFFISNLGQAGGSEASRRRASEGCSLNGYVHRCTRLSDILEGFDRVKSYFSEWVAGSSPRLDCLTDRESRGVCKKGEFLCLDPGARLLDQKVLDENNVTRNYCFLERMWSLCQPSNYASSRPDDCLDSVTSYGVCGKGENLCGWGQLNKFSPSLRARLQVPKVKSRCIAQALPTGDVHVVIAMRDASPTMKVVEDIALMGLTNSIVFLYRRADSGLNVAGTVSSAPIAGFPCGLTVVEKLLVPNRGNEAAAYLAHIAEYYDNLPSFLVFMHDHGIRSWHSELRPMFKRTRAFYLLMASKLQGADGKPVYPELSQFPSYPYVRRFTENVVTLNSCYCSRLKEPLCWDKYTMNAYERDTNRTVHDPKSEELHHRCKRVVQSLRIQKSNLSHSNLSQSEGPGPGLEGRRLLWQEPPEAIQQSDKIFRRILDRRGQPKRMPDGAQDVPFWSCCAMFITQARQVRRQPRQYYLESLDALLSTNQLSHFTGRWFEFNWYELLFDPAGGSDPLRPRLYLEIDDVYAEIYDEKNPLEDLQQFLDA
ncbi:hypothetical protein GUITHDRAFT_144831 [Guillardia theta CCMP2712]|uniref:Uncharacterized protein n=1 Tax=Guillardia theta (strain CCMP2712) TaxID=905079 RepID=L1IN66_GUITC|nr:hypothetical protein GUITHDRAFT_144831 [Guillardia theta CCMP2712]EKX37708.1 hypothetical protein GUITHDRAFT_144831 [Guillardia theta CCMP2712]|eukprot:XP_005824688.1 hypothetical protein GUITHDRAFT_144831 [Guillardia theta CCMP2712]